MLGGRVLGAPGGQMLWNAASSLLEEHERGLSLLVTVVPASENGCD